MIFPPLNTYYLSVLGQILTCKALQDRVVMVEAVGQGGLKVIEVLEVLEVDEALGVLL